MAAKGISPQVREMVAHRASYQCERCYRPVPGIAASVHHRRPRQMGGTKRPDANEPGNLLLLCGSGVTGCHGWVESNRSEARSLGLLLHSGDVPAHHPYCDAAGHWWLLTNMGQRFPVVLPGVG